MPLISLTAPGSERRFPLENASSGQVHDMSARWGAVVARWGQFQHSGLFVVTPRTSTHTEHVQYIDLCDALTQMDIEIEFRAVPREQAVKEILHYVQLHPHKDSYDIAIALRLDFDLVHELCEELVTQNRLAPSDLRQLDQD